MTREEAIEVIKDIYNYTKWDTYTTDEARTMAIKALEQKPSDDAISRQEVFDLINDQKDVFYSEGDRGLFGSYVNELPPVTPQKLDVEPFAKWVAKELFDDIWEDNPNAFDAFAELACRKLEKLGLVRANGGEWELVEPQESEE